MLDNEVGVGTTATLFLRKASVVPLAEHRPVDTLHFGVKARGRVLLVEDSADVREVTASMVASLGFEVGAFDNAADGLQERRGSANDYEFVNTDPGLPGGVDGMELMRFIRAEFDVPVVSISGYAATLGHVEPALGDRHL